MRTMLKIAVIVALVATSVSAPSAERLVPSATGPAFQSIGPLAFGPGGVLFAGDRQAGTVFALDLGSQATGGAAGTKDIAGIDEKIAATLGTTAAEITITDLAVHPTSHNSYVSVMRGQGAAAQSALLRIDGAGQIKLVAMDTVKFTSVAIPNPTAGTGRTGRADAITDLAFTNGRLFVAGLSNEEFASKLWSLAYPFATADNGTSVEIFHGNHNAVETRSPVYAFIPYTVNAKPHLIAGYLCTPLVKFPVDTLTPGQKIRGTTIAELGAGNRPIDMILYSKDGKDYLLMSNTSRGVMKIPTANFGTAAPITERVGGTAGIPYETIAAMTGIEQLDLLDATHSIVIAKVGTARNLSAVVLP